MHAESTKLSLAFNLVQRDTARALQFPQLLHSEDLRDVLSIFGLETPSSQQHPIHSGHHGPAMPFSSIVATSHSSRIYV